MRLLRVPVHLSIYRIQVTPASFLIRFICLHFRVFGRSLTHIVFPTFFLSELMHVVIDLSQCTVPHGSPDDRLP